MLSQTVQIATQRFKKGIAREALDFLAMEEPLEIRLAFSQAGSKREKSISITMRTPGHDTELAIGFLFTEGILQNIKDVVSVDGCGPRAETHQGQNIIKVFLAEHTEIQWPKLERHFYSTSSCGVCGKASLEALEVQGIKPIHRDHFKVSYSEIATLTPKMRKHQSVFDQTGGLHASALFDARGQLIELREDVGRHNALDKLIGAQVMGGKTPLSDCLLFLSGRASFELVQKAVVAGIPFIAAVGAPSSLAVDLAKKFDVTLLGFVREDRFNIYHGPWRLTGDWG